MTCQRRNLVYGPAVLFVPLIVAALACAPSGNLSLGGSPTEAPTATQASGCVLPDVVGLDEDAAREALAALGLTALGVTQRDDAVEKGRVVSLAPAPGTRIDPCAGEVTLVVSSGPASGKATPVAPTPVPAASDDYPDQDDIPMFLNTHYQERFDTRLYGFASGWSVDASETTSDITLTDAGELSIDGYVLATAGDSSWFNYRVTFGGGYYDEIERFYLLARVQDSGNFVGMECFPSEGWLVCEGRKVTGGSEGSVAGFQQTTRFCAVGQIQCDITFEALGNQFSVFVNGDQVAGFTDDTFAQGAVGFVVEGKYILDYFDVYEPAGGASLGYTLFRDDFDTNGWSVGVDEDDYAVTYKAIEDGVYRWKVTAKQGVTASEIRDVRPSVDVGSFPYRFDYTVAARQVSAPAGAAHGLLFRARDYDNFYYFRVEDSGNASLYALVDNTWSELAGPVYAEAFVLGEVNQLRVVAEGERFSFWINGQYLGQVTDDHFSIGGIGLAVELSELADEGEFEFDDVRIGIPPQ